MTLLDRLLFFSVLSVSGVALIFNVARALQLDSHLEKDHRGSHLCHEVAQELAWQVEDDLIDKKVAARIIARCFEKFGDSTDV